MITVLISDNIVIIFIFGHVIVIERQNFKLYQKMQNLIHNIKLLWQIKICTLTK